MKDLTITVSAAGTAAARTFAYEISSLGKTLAKRTLAPVESSQVTEIGSQYFSLLRGAGRSDSKSYLSILARSLSRLFLEAGAQEWRDEVLPVDRLVISSSIPEVLQLPWELLSIAGNDQVGCSIPIIRRPGGEVSGSLPKPSAGPLRMLFMAADSVDYEEEEKRAQRMGEGLNMEIAVSESGRPEDLRALAEQFRPHLIHLAVRAKVAGGVAVLSLAGGSESSADMPAEDLADLLCGAAEWGIIVSGMFGDDQSGRHLLCQGLSQKFPLALAIDGPIDSVLPLYSSLSSGNTLEEALISTGRESAAYSSEGFAFMPFAGLYSIQSSVFGPMIDPDLKPVLSEFRACLDLESLPGLAEGRTKCFVGRRKETQRLFAPMREGSVQTLVITGPDGSGKSALAVRLSSLLARAGYSLIPVYSSPQNGITCTRIFEAVADMLGKRGLDEEAGRLREPGPIQRRLEGLMDVLRSHRMLMLLDGLDLDDKSQRIQDPDLSRFYLMIIRGLAASRAIITCRSLPADALTLPSRTWQWKIEGLSQAAFARCLLSGSEAAARYRRGEIKYEHLSDHHRVSSGLPNRLAQTSRAIGLYDIAPGEDALVGLVSRLEEESAIALSRAAIYGTAISPAGLGAVCGLTEDEALKAAQRWEALSLAQFSGGLWTVPSSLRQSLQSRLSPEEIRSAHKAAAVFLKDNARAGRSADLELSRLDSFLEARGHFIAAREWDDAAEVTGQISGYLRGRGYYDEIIRLNMQVALSCASCRARPAAWIGQAYLDSEDFKKAEEWYALAVEIAAEMAAYHGLGISLMKQGKDGRAAEHLQKAADGFRAAGDLSGEAASLSALAALDMKKGEIGAAVERLDRIAETMRSLGDVPAEAQALQESARLEMIGKNFEGARERLTRSLELLQSIQDERGAAYALFNLASLDLEKGDFREAGEEYARALPIFRNIHDLGGQAAILHSQGLIHSQAGEKDLAAGSFKEALTINQVLGDKAAEAGSFFQLGALAVQQDKIAEGLRLMALAAVVLRSIKSDEVQSVEPLVERLASQLNYSQEQFTVLVQEVLHSYAKDRGRGLVERALGG
ncbi:MAG: tetratricopeptide repeat protein [Methanothrix sp.]